MSFFKNVFRQEAGRETHSISNFGLLSDFGDSDFGFGIRFLGCDTAFTPHFVLECPDTPRLDASHRVMAT